MQATKLPLNTWFLAIYLIGQAKIGIFSLELSRHLGRIRPGCCIIKPERDEAYLLRENIQIDDAYLGRELSGGKAGRGSENKIPIFAAVSLNEAGHPIHARITALRGLRLRSDL